MGERTGAPGAGVPSVPSASASAERPPEFQAETASAASLSSVYPAALPALEFSEELS